MSNDGSKLDKSTLGLEFLEQEVDGARVVMVAKPEVVVDKIREMQKEFNNQLLSVMNRIKNLSKCGSCKKEKQVYSVKRTNCTEQSVKSHGKGRHLLPECSNWAAISKVKSYRRIGSPSHVSWVQGASPTHPKKTQSFARRWIDYPKDEANNTCGAALEVLAQCDDCENTGYREEVERKYCSEHTTILGSKPNWSARINFNNCANLSWFNKTYYQDIPEPVEFGTMQAKTKEKLTEEKLEEAKLRKKIDELDNLILRVLTKALDS